MNFYGTILGWLVWNLVELTLRQRELSEDGDNSTNFNIVEFAKQKYLQWITSLLVGFMLLWIGAKNLNLDPLAPLTGHALGWSDLYYLGSGAAFELIVFIVIKIKKLANKQ